MFLSPSYYKSSTKYIFLQFSDSSEAIRRKQAEGYQLYIILENQISLFLMLAHLFDHLLWSVFQSLHIYANP